MAFTRVLKGRSRPSDPAEKLPLAPGGESLTPVGRDQSGIALFIVLAAIGVLAILVTEFTYVSQITQAVAFGSLDQVKAHYLAKSALKLSLLRLKAYKNVKDKLSTLGAGADVPKGMIEQIWSFPFSYPIPSNIPGLNQTDRDAINKFQKDSGFEGGSYTTNIESESSKYNLNLLLPNYASIAAAIKPPRPGTPPVQPNPNPVPSPTVTSTIPFDPEAAREGLFDYLNTIVTNKIQTDPEFNDNRRNFRLQDLVDNISSWADRTFVQRSTRIDSKIPFKKAPFYSISELHMVPAMDDEMYNLLTPALTTSATIGININAMKEPVLRALIRGITTEEVTDFFKFRDATDVDNKFKAEEDFYDYIKRGIAGFVNNPQAITELKSRLAKQSIKLVTEESQFKITVQANVNNSYRTIEAWVDLSSDAPKPAPGPGGTNVSVDGSITGGTPNAGTPSAGSGSPGGRNVPDPGLKITFMRII
ncbi:MAG: hypothetical protein ABIQ95_13720 [Bdellovibrionia bacterium]